jgi:uncharacterized protein
MATPCDEHPSRPMIHAIAQFNRGEYWQQHETLEAIWRAETDQSIRNFYKGILQIGVGFHHLSRRNYSGAIKVLGRGIGYLQPYAPHCCGVDVDRLIWESTRVLEQIELFGADRIGEYDVSSLPQVHFEEM